MCVSLDLQRLKDANIELKKMRSKPLHFQPLLQSCYPTIPYKGKWVKVSRVLADVLSEAIPLIEDDNKSIQRALKLGAISIFTKYSTDVGEDNSIFMLSAIGGIPQGIIRVALDSASSITNSDRAKHRTRWLGIDESSNPAELTYKVGYGGDKKAISSSKYAYVEAPTIGVYLYPFNIRNFWIFLPDFESDIYGIVNCSKNTMFDAGWRDYP